MRVASLDFGTNTFLCLICDVVGGEIGEVVEDLSEVVRLGEGVHASRRLSPAALLRAEQAMATFRKRMDACGVKKVAAVATSAARDVENGEELFRLAKKYQIPLKIVSGAQEAAFTFHGALVGCLWPAVDVVVVDIGGGSTEVISQKQDRSILAQSFNLGSVRLTELFFPSAPVTGEQLTKCKRFVRDELRSSAEFFSAQQGKIAIAVAGTPTTLAALNLGRDFVAEEIEGRILSLDSLMDWEERFSVMTLQEIQMLTGMHPRRADVILAGTLLLRLLAEHLNIREYVVSTRGVRYGLAKTMDQF